MKKLGGKMEELMQWLASGPRWIINQVQKNFSEEYDLGEFQQGNRELLEKDPKFMQLLSDCLKWDTAVLKRHNDAAHPIHKISFLADLGYTIQENHIRHIVQKINANLSDQEIFQSLCNYPSHFGGSGKDEWVWCLCDAPLVLYSLIKFDGEHKETYLPSYQILESLARENGWPCAASPKLGSLKGPGKRTDPCPYANLLMLKLAALLPNHRDQSQVNHGINCLLDLWEHSREEHPFLFKMGRNFRKLKVPLIWYDILHVAIVLSNYPQAQRDPRFQSMVTIILEKGDSSFRFKSESIWTKWKGWEFCQKKEPSRWVTFQVMRLLKNIHQWPPQLNGLEKPL